MDRALKRRKEEQARAVIRQGYRSALQHLSENREELSNPENYKTRKARNLVNALYNNVTHTREAAMDSEALLALSSVALEKAQRMQTNFQKFDPVSFMHMVTEQLDSEGAWSVMGLKTLNQYMLRTPSIGFMLGPIQAEAKKKKSRVSQKKDDYGKETNPEEVVDTQANAQQATASRILEVKTILKENKELPWALLVTNPDSFAQTVENIFHFAFVVKDGEARVESRNGEIWACFVNRVASTSTTHKKQCVVPMDYNIWQAMKARYNITKSLIPHRPV
eukprot:CAMPEP_0177669096 /NCGR_PEP_ID=MMETSP0447-20121125/23220_1 /TAXON_ID=0 /ORGANISM="Stygamoeba regulata, Strain BSH-02190019" /LENGTH=277 /DNA_ID=CAMNT_0019175863 /DNA_START=12 /DNA_END=842 /DNA_ORIENTATION=-